MVSRCSYAPSLHALWIGNAIVRALNHSPSTLPTNFVYRHASIEKLAGFALGLAEGRDAPEDDTPRVEDLMRQLVARFSYETSDLAQTPPNTGLGQRDVDVRDVVVVTGTTGALGSSVLAKLVEMEHVSHVYAFNRRSTDGRTLEERQREALLKRHLDPHVASSAKVSLREVDFEHPELGLSEALLEELRDSVTHIFHFGACFVFL